MDIDLLNSGEKKNIFRLTTWRRNAKRGISMESMTEFVRDQEFRNRMKIIEMKIFVDDGMLVRMKITLTI